MKSTIKLFFLVAVFSVSVFSQTEQKATVTQLSLTANSPLVEATGKIDDGLILSSLRWAEQSNVACFPGTRFEMFTGKHVFYRITLPRASAMTITVTPKSNAQINLYALRQGMNATDQTIPPNVKSAISCEASYPKYANLPGGRVAGGKDDGIRKVEYISVGSPFSILIGVAGAKGLTAGEFDLKVEIKPR